MPVYEYVAAECRREPPCSRRKEYLQPLTAPVESRCRECGSGISRVLSRFSAKSGPFGVSSPDPTPLNLTGIPAPADYEATEDGCSGADHLH
jgi:hypothetical protein